MTSSSVIIEQVLNKILEDGSVDFIEKYSLTEEYFAGYTNQYYFILSHVEKYGNVPDKLTFASEFPNFNFFRVTETEEYLYKNIFDNRYYNYIAETWTRVTEQIGENPTEAIEKFKAALEIAPSYKKSIGFDIIKDSFIRLQSIVTRSQKENGFFIPCGFDELDVPFNGGWSRGEELAVIFGRTGNGKTFVLLKMLFSAFNSGNRVGFISPEMSCEKVGFRFDTIGKGFSNSLLNSGRIVYNEEIFSKYNEYIEELAKSSNAFIVAETSDFDKKMTVSKLRTFIMQNQLDIVGIDGLSYMVDERGKKGDNKTTALTNISADLITLSKELKVPIIVAVQANRGGVKQEDDEGTPDLENIRDSDGIAHACTKIISLRQIHDRIDLCIKKNRDNVNGQTFSYYFDPDAGVFQFEELERNASSYRGQTNTPAAREGRGSTRGGGAATTTPSRSRRGVTEF